MTQSIVNKTTLIATLALQLAAAAALAQTEGAPESESSLAVSRVVLSRGFADGEPVDETTSFARSDGRIYVRIHLTNPSRAESTIRVRIVNGEGRGAGGVTLEIPARPEYRSLARFGTQRAAGSYRVVIEDSEGNEISSTPLTVTE